MDVPFDQPGAGGNSPHNSFSGAEIFVEQPPDGGGGPNGGGGGQEDGRFHTSGITMYEEDGNGNGDDRYEDRYVDDQGGYGHQNPAAYGDHPDAFRHRHHAPGYDEGDHEGAAGYGGEDDFGGGGGGGGGGHGGEYEDDNYDDEYGDIGFDGRDLRSEPSRSSSSRSLLSKQSRSSRSMASSASRQSSSYSNDSRRDPQMQYQQPQYQYQQQQQQAQPQYSQQGYAEGGRTSGYAEEDEYYYDEESKFGGDSHYGGGQSQSVVTDYSNYPQENDGQDLPCISLAGYELGSMKFAQRRHVSYLEQTQSFRGGGGGNNKGGQTILDEFSDIPLPSRQSYPADCLQILRLLDSNGGCVDCGAGLDGQSEPPMWASISYGTLLCDKCAFVHLTKSEEKAFAHMSMVKHLDTGYWTLPETLTMLEGGNGNFLLAVQGHKQMRRPNGLERRTTQRLGKGGKLGLSGLAPIDEEGSNMPFVGGGKGGPGITGAGGLAQGGLFEAKYKNKQAASYCATLQQRVQAVCGAFECTQGLPFDVAQQDVQVDQFLERPVPARVRLRDPPTREEILQAKMDASRTSAISKSRGDSTISGSSRFGTTTTRSSGTSSRNLSAVRNKASSGMRSVTSNKSKASGASSRWSSSAGSSSSGDEPSRTRRGSNGGRRQQQPSQIHTIYEEDGQSEVSSSSQPPRRASNESKQESATSATTGRSSKAPSASDSAKNSPKRMVADPPSSSVQNGAPKPERRNSAGASAGPCPPTKLVRRASDPARVPNSVQEKKNKMRKQTKRQKKQERRRRASLS